jgi:hypothetical protein
MPLSVLNGVVLQIAVSTREGKMKINNYGEENLEVACEHSGAVQRQKGTWHPCSEV